MWVIVLAVTQQQRERDPDQKEWLGNGENDRNEREARNAKQLGAM